MNTLFGQSSVSRFNAPALSTLSGVAIDFGGTKIAVARYENGVQIDRHQVATHGEVSVDQQIDAITDLLRQVRLTEHDLLGVAVTGRVDRDGNWYAVNTDTLTKIDKVPLLSLLAQRLESKLVVINDAVAGAFAEAHYGAGSGVNNLAYITVSTGVGGLCVIDGLPLTSQSGLAGHAGFMASRYANERCGSGRLATVESVASGRAISQAAKAAGYENLTAKQVFSHRDNQEAWAIDSVNRSAQAIADLCANLVALAGIERVVLGGSIGLAEGYRQQVQAFMHEEPALFQTEILCASLGQNSVLLGALAAVSHNQVW